MSIVRLLLLLLPVLLLTPLVLSYDIYGSISAQTERDRVYIYKLTFIRAKQSDPAHDAGFIVRSNYCYGCCQEIEFLER